MLGPVNSNTGRWIASVVYRYVETLEEASLIGSRDTLLKDDLPHGVELFEWCSGKPVLFHRGSHSRA